MKTILASRQVPYLEWVATMVSGGTPLDNILVVRGHFSRMCTRCGVERRGQMCQSDDRSGDLFWRCLTCDLIEYYTNAYKTEKPK